VMVNAEGNLELATDHSQVGDQVTLRFEMDSLVLMHTCPHPMNQSADYPQSRVQIELGVAQAVQQDDYCMHFRAENTRGFQNNALYHIGVGA
ncbi:MAG: urea carboxylase, partial [Candidatus Thiodiazotropha taylori]|nr:urea carboxylase [Candidatus Thiodiazotropha taylori]MCW4254811.1 urea carboxylase [Candidatus Thiodiazotropha taylori]